LNWPPEPSRSGTALRLMRPSGEAFGKAQANLNILQYLPIRTECRRRCGAILCTESWNPRLLERLDPVRGIPQGLDHADFHDSRINAGGLGVLLARVQHQRVALQYGE
jgi:hypothetical protein